MCIFSLFLSSGVLGWGFPWLCPFCWGIRKVKEGGLSLSWCPGGELGARRSAVVGLLGVGVVGVCLCTGCGFSDL